MANAVNLLAVVLPVAEVRPTLEVCPEAPEVHVELAAERHHEPRLVCHTHFPSKLISILYKLRDFTRNLGKNSRCISFYTYWFNTPIVSIQLSLHLSLLGTLAGFLFWKLINL